MARKKRENKNSKEEEIKEEGIKEKVAKIGEFATPNPNGEIPPENEKIPNSEIPPENEKIPNSEIPPEEKPKGISPEELKEKVIFLLSEAFSRGLPEEEKKKFTENFKFWNELIFNFLDIGNNLGSVLEEAKVKLTPTKAVTLYTVGTLALVFALRPDLIDKITGKRKPEEQKPTETPPPSNEGKVAEEPK